MPRSAASPSPLVSYALRGLRRCWMPEYGRYSHRCRLDGVTPENESIPESDAFYTLNVLLGFSRLAPGLRDREIDASATYYRCCGEASNPHFTPYACGMGLWAGATLGLSPPGALLDRAHRLVAADTELAKLTCQDIGMLLCGTAALAAADGHRWRPPADRLARALNERWRHPRTGLFAHRAAGLRRRFSSFASQVYGTLALYRYGEAFAADWAIGLADASAAAIIERQGRRGEWGWFYDAAAGRVVDFYEIYSVHQHGMAPAFLHHAVRRAVPGARAALVKGFLWLFGDNEMGVSMLRPAEHLFYRSQLRRGEDRRSWPRLRRSLESAAAHRSDRPDRHAGLELRRECRSYELGWILWSFGANAEYPELTERREFAV